MRSSALLLGLVFLSGCGGSKSSEPVDLSIDNPKKATAADTQLPASTIETPENARKLLVHAARLAKQGLVGKAVEQLSHAISMNAEDPELYIARAEVYGMMREDANALADYSTAIRVRPEDSSIYNRRGFFLLSRSEHTRALKDFGAAIELNPQSPQAHNNRGLVYLSISQPEKAIADFGKAATLDPKYADAWNNRGFANYKIRKFPEALKDLNHAIKAKPGYVNALNNRALVYLAMKNHKSAIADLTTAIGSAPYEIKLFQARRTAYLELQQFEKAQKDGSRVQWLVGLASLTKEIDREPLVYQHYIRRGDYLTQGNEHVAAIRDYSTAMQVNKTTTEPIVKRASALLALGKSEDAIRDCTTAIKLSEQLSGTKGKKDIGDFDTNVQMRDPKQAYSVRGDAWMSRGDYNRAVADFERAERFDTAVADAYLHQARAFEKAGNRQKATAARKQAAAIDPSRRL